MDEKTKQAIREWLEAHRGDAEWLARWMSRTLRLGGMKDCRALIAEARS